MTGSLGIAASAVEVEPVTTGPAFANGAVKMVRASKVRKGVLNMEG
jgi:hypothetical protein